MSYISYLLAAHSEKPGVYKVKQGSIPKPALLCRDYRMICLSLLPNLLILTVKKCEKWYSV
jgi:hypothetical protein